jgi:hypothetical protein
MIPILSNFTLQRINSLKGKIDIKALKTVKKLFSMVINGEGRHKTVKDDGER